MEISQSFVAFSEYVNFKQDFQKKLFILCFLSELDMYSLNSTVSHITKRCIKKVIQIKFATINNLNKIMVVTISIDFEANLQIHSFTNDFRMGTI